MTDLVRELHDWREASFIKRLRWRISDGWPDAYIGTPDGKVHAAEMNGTEAELLGEAKRSPVEIYKRMYVNGRIDEQELERRLERALVDG